MENRIFEVRQVRSFDQILSATFTFLRIVFKPFFKSLIVIAGPVLLVTGVIYGLAYSSLINMMGHMPQFDANDINSILLLYVQFGIVFILAMIAALLAWTASNSFIILYTDSRGIAPTLGEVWRRTRQSLLRVIGTGLALWLMSATAFGILIVIGVLMSGDRPSILFILLIAFVIIPFSIYASVSLSPIFFMRMQEPIGLFEAIGRCFKLIRGYWWQTFGILFLMYIITIAISYGMAIPQFILIGIRAAVADESAGPLISILLVVFTALTFIASQFISSSLFNVAVALQYYNLVERKEAVGLRGRVQDLEQPGSPEGAA